jgi:serine/threonine protein kinase
MCRFFRWRSEFDQKVALYNDPVLRSTLPDLLRADDNASGVTQSKSGYVFPPWLVLERGTTLADWVRRPRGYGEVLTMVESLARMLATLHAAELVHRDLKPDNALYLLQSAQWRLLDLGIVARAGAP